MRYKRKTIDKFKYDALLVLFGFFVVAMVPNFLKKPALAWPVRPYADVIEIEQLVEVPVEVPVGCDTRKCMIMAYIMERFGDDASDAITMLNKCENHALDPNATNHNKNGTIDRGVFQINSSVNFFLQDTTDLV